jgi:hypothetical protein
LILLLVRLLFALLGVFAGVGALLLWIALALVLLLATTTSGLRMVVQTLDAAGWVQVERAEGSLLGRMSLHGVVVHAGQNTLNVKCAELDWQPMALLQRQVLVNQLWLSGVRVDVAESATPKEETSEPWTGLALPFAVFVDDFQVDGVSLRTSKPEYAAPPSPQRPPWLRLSTAGGGEKETPYLKWTVMDLPPPHLRGRVGERGRCEVIPSRLSTSLMRVFRSKKQGYICTTFSLKAWWAWRVLA